MKILRVSLENLNSLRGKHAIDFTTPAFASGLFAITGPTGAGKSTVLDAICLALFHRTPRQASVGQGQNEVMSSGTGECSAEVEFSTGKASYRASWTQRRAHRRPDGALQAPRASLSRLDGNLLCDRTGDTERMIAEVLGLSFAQFSRSVLLAQGSFDAFLKAKDNERSELLERLTATGIYGDISKAVYERTRHEGNQLSALELQLGGIRVLTADDRADAERRLADAQGSLRDREAAHQQARTALTWHQDRGTLSTQAEQARAALTEVEQSAEAARPDLDALRQAELAEPLGDLHRALERALRARADADAAVASLRTSLDDASEHRRLRTWHALLAAQAAQQAASDALTAHEAQRQRVEEQMQGLGVDDGLGEKLAEWRALIDAESLARATMARAEAEARAAAEAQQIAANEEQAAARQHADMHAEQRQASAARLRAQQALDEALQGRTRDQLLEALHHAQRQRERLQALPPMLERIADLQARKDQADAALRSARESLPELEAQARDLERQEQDAAALLGTLRAAASSAARIRDLDAHRQQLRQGEPCPLCGATEHPLIDAYREVDPSTCEQQVRDQEARCTRITAEAEAARRACQAGLHHIEQRNHALAAQRAALDEVREEWSRACAALAVAPEDATQLTALIQTAERACETAEARRSTVDGLHKAAAAADQALLCADAAHRDAHARLQQQQTRSEAAQAGHREAQARQARAATELERARGSLSASMAADLVPAAIPPWLAGQEQAWARYKDLRERRAELARAHPLLQGQASEAARWTEAARREWDAGGWDAPASMPLSGDGYAALAKQAQASATRVAHLQGQLEAAAGQASQAASRCELAQAALQGAIRASAFASHEALVEALRAPAELQRLRGIDADLRERLQAARMLSAERLQRLQAHEQSRPGDASLAELEQAATTLMADIEAVREQVIGLRTQLKGDDGHRQDAAALMARIDAARRVYDDWQHLNGLIGSASGQSFRKFAQGLTLDRLVHLANRHLRNLDGGHFSILRSDSGLGLSVEDAWDGGARRDASTLSGGESFLVSLALALGLSDLVSNMTAIDSLFLDEGFGTLDADTLTQAMDAIERLNATGKLIGVISHVDAVKERIPVQIKVLPTARLGSSRLELPR